MIDPISKALHDAYDPALADELMAAYVDAKRNFHAGGHRLSAVEGGRFCEAAYRILQQLAWGKFTAIGAQLDTDKLEKSLFQLSSQVAKRSVRIYLPRALRVVYDIRNNRDAAHLADDIDPNLQDATLVVSVISWVLAEFVRLSGKLSPDEAQRIIEGLVTRDVPVIQEFEGHPKVLRTDLRASEYVLVLLYYAGPRQVRIADLVDWVPASMRKNLRRTLKTLDEKVLVHLVSADRVQITYAGQRHVDVRRLLDPDGPPGG